MGDTERIIMIKVANGEPRETGAICGRCEFDMEKFLKGSEKFNAISARNGKSSTFCSR